MPELNPMISPPPKRDFNLSPRDLLILLASGGAGVATLILLASAGMPFGQTVVAAFSAFGAVFYFLDKYTSAED